MSTTKQKQHRRELVAALRSGDYKQGCGALLSIDTKFCCLGVACDISGVGRWQSQKPSPENGWDNTPKFLYFKDYAVMPEEVMEYYGFTTSLGLFTEPGTRHSTTLACLNDEDKLSFDEIANIIESEPEGMFI